MNVAPWQDCINRRCTTHRRFIEIIGDLVTLRTDLIHSKVPIETKRGEVKGFSDSARYRLVKQIAQVDWNAIPKSLLITLTYPDHLAAQDYKACTMQRHVWIRYVEKYLSEQIPMLWRKEGQIRKSGQHKGKAVSHFHLIVFTPKFLPKEMVRQWWQLAIRENGDVATDVRRMNDGLHGAMYVAKYLTKERGTPTLDNAAYLNKQGRTWGWHRRHLVPMHQSELAEDLTDEEFNEVWEVARRLRTDGTVRQGEKITLIGDNARKIKSLIAMMRACQKPE